MKQVGVYILRNVLTGTFYIGSTSDYIKRRGNHLSMLRNGTHLNPRLQSMFTPVENTSWEFTPTVDRQAAYVLEGELISRHMGNPLLCNVSTNPYGSMPGHNRGHVVSDETKAKMSASRTGVPKSAEWVDKIADSRRIVIEVDGVVYRSATDAAAAHGVPINTVMRRARSTLPKYRNWCIKN